MPAGSARSVIAAKATGVHRGDVTSYRCAFSWRVPPRPPVDVTTCPTMTSVRWSMLAPFAVAAAVSATLTCPAASATPSEGIEAKTLSQSSHDGKDYITRELTIAPGGSTGWHYHDGQVFGVVREGTLTHDMSNCTIDGVYGPGASITE